MDPLEMSPLLGPFVLSALGHQSCAFLGPSSVCFVSSTATPAARLGPAVAAVFVPRNPLWSAARQPLGLSAATHPTAARGCRASEAQSGRGRRSLGSEFPPDFVCHGVCSCGRLHLRGRGAGEARRRPGQAQALAGPPRRFL
jgi:hypothetical protein